MFALVTAQLVGDGKKRPIEDCAIIVGQVDQSRLLYQPAELVG
jgi:hypothetical protein